MCFLCHRCRIILVKVKNCVKRMKKINFNFWLSTADTWEFKNFELWFNILESLSLVQVLNLGKIKNVQIVSNADQIPKPKVASLINKHFRPFKISNRKKCHEKSSLVPSQKRNPVEKRLDMQALHICCRP